jgi:hypothetical protein
MIRSVVMLRSIDEEDIIFVMEPGLFSIGTISLPENFQFVETTKYTHTSLLNFRITI